MRSSVAIARANPPVKHMPIAPTPGPPQRWCSSAANARIHSTAGEVLPVARIVKSLLMQARPIVPSMFDAAPTTPRFDGDGS